MNIHFLSEFNKKLFLMFVLGGVILFGHGFVYAASTVIIDDSSVVGSKGLKGFWLKKPAKWSTLSDSNAYSGSHHKAKNQNRLGNVRWYPVLGAGNAGSYKVYAWWVQSSTNINVTYQIKYSAGASDTVSKNQKDIGNAWVLLGEYPFNGTTSEYVRMDGVRNASADAIKFEPVVSNNAPVATPDSITVAEGGIVATLDGGAVSVLANDTDADGDSLTAVKLTDVSHGLLSFNSDGTFSYTHDASETTSDSFTYKATDGTDDSNTVTVSITITPVNDPPVANNDSYTVSASSSNTLDVMANDTDPDSGDTMTILIVNTAGTIGGVVNNGTNITYTAPGAGGNDSFTYTVNDSAGVQSTATVNITISAANSPPTAVDDALSVDEDTVGNVLDLLANDSDVDVGDTVSVYSVDTTGTLGTVVNNGTNVTYTPSAGYVGNDSFTYVLADNHGATATATVTVTVNNVNDPPVATGESISVLSGTSSSTLTSGDSSVLANDTDIDGDTLTAVLVGAVSHGTLVLNSDGTFIYTNDGGGATSDGFTYQANDGIAASNTVNVSITVVAAGVHALSGHTVNDFTSMPINLTDSAIPLVMIAASNDHQLFFKAYDDYSDIDDDGIVDTTYKFTISYYGYFDSYKCYDYSATNGRFEPISDSDSDHYCTVAGGGNWSGNFLNWISMSRIDSIRKILFGGHRRVDTATDTVLERAYLPHDAHAWAKFYNGTDYDKMTPFSVTGNGITFCNTTDVNGSYSSEDSYVMLSEPPLIKVVDGNYSLWAGNERWQCTWSSGAPYDNHGASNGNIPADSGINAQSSSPAYSAGLGEKNYIARVQACVTGLIGHERCKQYPNGNYKPIGLLQVYGDDDQLYFGMVAGSYNKHVSGGVLIRNVGSITDEVNVATDGTFPLVAQIAGGPKSNNQADGLVNAWSLYRIIGYNYADGTYNSTDNCSWGLSAFADVSGANECRNWGNPFSEIYFQALRYFSDAGVTGTYRSNSSTGITGLPTPKPWPNPNPLANTNSCANLNIVAFNSSIASYDGDELDANSPGVQEIWDASVLPGAGTSADMTDVVGNGEGITGNDYFIGETSADTDQLCTAKTISSLGDVDGICPESPRMRGSYKIAGLAYYAHTEDIRASYLNGNRALDGVQKVDTYVVSSSASSPKIYIPHPITHTTAAIILPACRNTSLSPEGNCALVDFKVVEQVIDNGSGVGSGKFYVNWEDSEQGGDYDQDMWGIIEYTIDGHTNLMTVTTDVDAQSTGYSMGFGYILSGTTEDGFHVHSGINSFTYTETAAISSGSSCSSGCATADSLSTADYTLGVSNAELLEEPLWYAAKWGGFKDSNGDNTPDLQSEWDSEDADGNPNPDGVPDNYFFAYNPQQLEDSLNRVFLEILNRTSSGTAAAVVSNNVRGEGALYQAFYEPQKQDSNSNVASWIGTIHGLWLDQYGYMREDDGNHILDNYDDDQVIETYFDSVENRTRVKRWTSSDPDTYTPVSYVTVELGDISPLWNAREQLYLPLLTDFDIASQRVYSDSAASGRYITTWFDTDGDEIVDNGEYVDFISANITASNYTFFDVNSEIAAGNLVDYIRGVEISGYRNRTVDYDGDGTTEVMRLGDIINSTPTLVGAPAESFDLLYRDSSYSAYKTKYNNRRNVLYVGANDGMLHAFNGGFFNSTNIEFSINGLKPDGSAATPHPLGAELWAYVPMNLQPHLQWLADPGYTHVYYMDLKPKVFDSKIFNSGIDAATGIDHPNGWGTVLVAGMRFGGGAMTIDTAGNGFLAAPNDTDDKTRRSAYVIMDVTDPESPPNLLGEIQLPDASFTTVYPATMAVKEQTPYTCPDDGTKYSNSTDCDNYCTAVCATADPNKWFLVFGSGVDSIATGESTSTAKLYIFDLAELSSPGTTIAVPLDPSCTLKTQGTSIKLISCDTAATNQFVGTPITIDEDLDYRADSIYWGTVGDSTANSGKMFTMSINEDENPANWDAPVTLLDPSQPVYAAATVGVDGTNLLTLNKWAFFGTGRLLVEGDKTSTATQSLYAVREKKTYICSVDSVLYYKSSVCDANCTTGTCSNTGSATVTTTELLDVTNLEVQTNGDIIWTPTGETGQDALNQLGVISTKTATETYFDVVERDIGNNWHGWKLDLPPINGTAGVDPATRMLSQQSLLGSILFTSVYQPSTDLCTTEGYSRLYGQYFKTGTGLPEPSVFGTNVYSYAGQTYTYSTRHLDLGFGMATSPAIHTGSGEGNQGLSVFTQLSTGTIVRTSATTSTGVQSGRRSWKQR